MSRGRTHQQPSLGVLFWIGFLLFLIVVYMANHNRIKEVIDNTGFVEVVFEERSTQEETPPVTDADPIAPDEVPPRERPGDATPTGEQVTEPTLDMDGLPATEDALGAGTEEDAQTTKDADTVVVAKPETPPSTRTVLYFLTLDDSGTILTEPVERTVPRSTSPLTDSIYALLSGPGPEELNRGYLSLIPENTRLLSARVENGVAYLDFSEEYRFNPLGVEGFQAQLQQTVLTATRFSAVDSVQILIEGERLEYLGGEGVYIGAPLTPSAAEG